VNVNVMNVLAVVFGSMGVGCVRNTARGEQDMFAGLFSWL
jgi:hypothetical protein